MPAAALRGLPLVMALVTLPAASSLSVESRTNSGCWLISAMPPDSKQASQERRRRRGVSSMRQGG